jgi:hypothetical protein
MNFIDKQHVPLVEIADDGGQIAGAFDGRARGNPQIDPEFARDDVRQRGFAQTRRRRKQSMVERLAAFARRFNRNAEYLLNPLLANEFG